MYRKLIALALAFTACSSIATAQSTPLRGPELRALRQLRREWPDSPYLFVSERKGPMTASNVRELVARTGLAARLPFPVHPHMLRHACGYKLANEGHDTRSLQHYLGHKNIAHTVRYTDLAPARFKGFLEGLSRSLSRPGDPAPTVSTRPLVDGHGTEMPAVKLTLARPNYRLLPRRGAWTTIAK
jgi:Phage integrase family